jgi:hypothetical protein
MGQRRLSANERARAALAENPFLSISGLMRPREVLFRLGDAHLGENQTAPEALAREHANILLVAPRQAVQAVSTAASR